MGNKSEVDEYLGKVNLSGSLNALLVIRLRSRMTGTAPPGVDDLLRCIRNVVRDIRILIAREFGSVSYAVMLWSCGEDLRGSDARAFLCFFDEYSDLQLDLSRRPFVNIIKRLEKIIVDILVSIHTPALTKNLITVFDDQL
ncbi:MAG: hypothetical protein EOP04_02840 [Proteobacteria bacterium]|nr:MAG: hypothetical protein EOP04_02840 [Pseudomonadota bacterium]